MSTAIQKPDPSEKRVRAWLNDYYALGGQLSPLPGERDLNFQLNNDDGRTFVCKITAASEDLAMLEAQHAALARLQTRSFPAIPRVLTTPDGASLVPLHPGPEAPVGRVLTYVPGTTLTKCAPYPPALLRDLGRTLGRFDKALMDFDHPALHYSFDWDLVHAGEVVTRYRELVTDASLREGIDRIHREFVDTVQPLLPELRKSVIHNDANDHNVLAEGRRITGLIDFGDMVHSCTVCDPAIAMAYAALGSDDLSEMMREMTLGYHEALPLEETELRVLFPMVRMRLAVSACMAAHQMRLRPDDPYLAISQQAIRRTLPKLLALDAGEVHQWLVKSLK